jgi:hypothetical protein
MSRFATSWMLFKRSMSVIGQNQKLLLFPVVITILTCIIMVFFVVPVAFVPTGHAVTSSAHWEALFRNTVTVDAQGEPAGLKPVAYAYLVAIYLASVFFATFFNVAFYNEIAHALRGEGVSLGRGLKVACSKVGAIFMWSLLTGLVGLLIKRLEQRFGVVGRWIVKLIGMAWSIASVFVVPVIVMGEPTADPIKLLRSSAATLKKTWGESLVGYAGVQFGGAMVFFGCLALSAAGVVAGIWLKLAWLAVAAVALSVLFLFGFFYVLNIASQVYLCALYLYASAGSAPAPYDDDLMNVAWKSK